MPMHMQPSVHAQSGCKVNTSLAAAQRCSSGIRRCVRRLSVVLAAGISGTVRVQQAAFGAARSRFLVRPTSQPTRQPAIAWTLWLYHDYHYRCSSKRHG